MFCQHYEQNINSSTDDGATIGRVGAPTADAGTDVGGVPSLLSNLQS
ncbi:MAG: hypothetical protein ITG02_11845 [Patulibacter sp.]|nr:hypothetical protein [Patulibacter sp.]